VNRTDKSVGGDAMEQTLISVFKERLGGLRARLLDLSNRNRLISFKHSDRARTHIRVVDELPDVLFSRLSNGKRMRFKSLPEPETEPQDEDSEEFLLELEAARATDELYKQEIEALGEDEMSSAKARDIERALRDRVREKLGMPPWVNEGTRSKEEFARLHGIDPNYDLPEPVSNGSDAEKHVDDDIQTLLYPQEMDRKLSGIVDQARTMAQEAGISTLRAAFGFLEWREADQSRIKHFSPLVLLPVTIERKSGAWRRYEIYGDGSEVETNKTLAIRLERDFGYVLPEFDNEDSPETYMAKVRASVTERLDWRVRRFVTIGNFGFSKLAMYTDLDPTLWPPEVGFGKDGLVWKILLGEERPDNGIVPPPDYEIDTPEIDAKKIHLITDADASQHSAIIDAVDGKNLVVSGPPGTGKSQTITNLIATSIASGKKVLFVAEKMAALDVVFSRLKQAELDPYCLELHSTKTSKAAVLESLKNRLELQDRIPEPHAFDSKIQELKTHRDRLNAYVEALNSPIGKLGLSVQQVLWGDIQARDAAGEAWKLVRDMRLEGIPDLTPDEHNVVQGALRNVLSRIPTLAGVRGSLRDHPWAWVGNDRLLPIHEEKACRTVRLWAEALHGLTEVVDEFRQRFGPLLQASPASIAHIAEQASKPPQAIDPLAVLMARAMTEEALREAVSEFLKTVVMPAQRAEESRVLALKHLPESGTKWDQWSQKTRNMLATIKDLAPAAQSLDDAAEVLLALQQDKTRLVQLAELARMLGTACGLDAPATVDFAIRANCAVGLIRQASRKVIAHRYPSLFSDSAEAVLARAIGRAQELADQRQSLEKAFILSPLPALDEVDRHARALRGAGGFGFLTHNVREAKKFYRSIAVSGSGAKTSEMAAQLTQLASYLDGCLRLSQDTKLSSLCGPWFDGVETPFHLLMDVHKWGCCVRSELAATDPLGAEIAKVLLEGPTELLERCAKQAEALDVNDVDSQLKTFGDVQTPLQQLLDTSQTKITNLQTALETVSGAGFSGSTPLSKIGNIIDCIGHLEHLRQATSAAKNDMEQKHISVQQIADAYQLAMTLADFNIPQKTAVQILSDGYSDNISWLRDWCNRLEPALTRAAQARADVDVELNIVRESFTEADDLESTEIETLIGRLEESLTHATDLGTWVQFLRARRKSGELAIGDLIETMIEHEIPADKGIAAYNGLVYRQLVEAAYDKFRILSDLDGLEIEDIRKEFRHLDRQLIELQRGKISSTLCHAPIPAGNGVGYKRDYTELALIRHELGKRRRHIPLRDLLDRAGTAVQQMKPCLMMSPLSVATYLKPGVMTFDLVVIDEASQMPPEDAVGALARADQCVIMGDSQQLPPTSFFRRFEEASELDDEEESEDVEAESILDQANNVFLPPRQLRWHYRSRHQSLIAFSNKEFYDNNLTIFPSPREIDDTIGVHLVQVNGQYADRRNLAEVRAITERAATFMRQHPDRSLGIVAVNQLQRDLINDEMERIFEQDRHARAYREKWERKQRGLYQFFVKNLENVQGDERDTIFISTVYGPNADGRVMQNFGPISQRNGHRRLNVLFTRAREQVVLFSSLRPEDIVLRETTRRGPRVLRSYIEYALTNRLDTGAITDRPPDSDFEVSVANRLQALGYKAVPQLGVAGFYIDIAVCHPEFPGTYLVGVECDGATYHSAKSARDRDRLREEVLKGLGWTLYRIWSTDWFRDPDGETEKLRLFIEQAANERRDLLTEPPVDEPTLKQTERQHDEGAEPIEEVSVLDQPSEPECPTDTESQWGQGDDDEQAATSVDEPERLATRTDAVEINDTVTFHYADEPENKRTVTIVFGNADINLGTINAHSPVGAALLEASVGEDVGVYGPQGKRTAIIDDIKKAKRANGAYEPAGNKTAENQKERERSLSGTGREGTDNVETVSPMSQASSHPKTVTPYRQWSRKTVPDPREANALQVARYLREIIEVEGPIRVQRAYRLYAHTCGIKRIGRVVRSKLNRALNHLVKKGDVLLEQEGPDQTQVNAIARSVGTPRVVVRTAGNRNFWDIPPSELAAVMESKASRPFTEDEELFHRVLSHYGIMRLTTNIEAELKRVYEDFYVAASVGRTSPLKSKRQ